MEKDIKKNLLKWFRKNQRILPWRKLYKNKLPNPYYIFVSEYMLQQTTVGTVKKRFEEFIIKWPSVNDLSKIRESQILKFWSGLGYYSRATNLLKATKIIKKKYGAKIPSNYNDLINLPGIGVYTANAILGIAFNKAVMPIDSNIERILTRLYGFQKPKSKIKNELSIKSKKFISKKFSTNLIQAFMDYGSIICTPRKPNCNQCFISANCIAYKKNLQNKIPIKKKLYSNKKKKYSRAYIVCNEKNEILVRKRTSKGMLASMLEIPNDKWVFNKKNLIHDKIILKVKNQLESKGIIEYPFSHFNLVTEVFFINVKKNIFLEYKWINKKNLNKSGFPTVMKKILEVGL